ncbi:LacI family DNA-binding transcriptional regulator [Periweissella fabalis]|uniref:LacI family transcriptional regulator n=1 Tax=Periweissella fabalis TaxID=1070421 RepID=A0A7X6S281_9LACO|nr:LacI family DNA-binding transcriptional regulator [Periweissella fabalis]MCM0599411.1 LacI family DNA-binding transcriptional regulator [Periweissella fabalis]NKZ23690.1 LacI family transcriptional regulator [Periweissella fabalis]
MLDIQYSLVDIANFCGVSPSTVSRAINNRGRISSETKNKILTVVNDLDFKVNPVASALRQKKMPNLAIIYYLSDYQKFHKLIANLSINGYEHGRLIFDCPINNKIELIKVLELLIEQNITTLLILDINNQTWLTALLNYARKNHIIWINGPYVKNSNIFNIQINYATAIKELTLSILKQGYRPILLNPFLEKNYFQAELQGFKIAHAQFHHLHPLILINSSDTTILKQQITSLSLISRQPLSVLTSQVKFIKALSDSSEYSVTPIVMYLDCVTITNLVFKLLQNWPKHKCASYIATTTVVPKKYV